MSKSKMGRPSLFPGAKVVRVQAVITALGGVQFAKRRAELIALYTEALGYPPKRVSAADVVEYLSRGEAATRKAFAASK